MSDDNLGRYVPDGQGRFRLVSDYEHDRRWQEIEEALFPEMKDPEFQRALAHDRRKAKAPKAPRYPEHTW